MKKQETNMLIGGALILGAYWFWKKKQDAEMGSYGAGGAYDWIGRGNAYDWISGDYGASGAYDWISRGINPNYATGSGTTRKQRIARRKARRKARQKRTYKRIQSALTDSSYGRY